MRRRQHVRVGLQGHRDVGVAEALLNHARVDTALQGDCRPGVPKAVE